MLFFPLYASSPFKAILSAFVDTGNLETLIGHLELKRCYDLTVAVKEMLRLTSIVFVMKTGKPTFTASRNQEIVSFTGLRHR